MGGLHENGHALEPGGAAPFGFQARPTLLVFKAGVEMLLRVEEPLSALGICGRDYAALAVLADDEPPSQQELARLLGKAPALVVAMVDELEGKGLVDRRRAEDDRRRCVVRLTDAGRRLLEQADAAAARVEAEVFGALPASDRAALHGMLRQALGAAEPVPAVALP